MSLYVLLSKVLYLAFFKIASFFLVNESLQYLAEVLNIFLLYYFNIFTGLVVLTVSIFSLPTSVWHSNICNWQLWRFLLFFQCWLQDCSLKSQRRTQGRTPVKQKEQQWKCLKFHFISVNCSLVLICKRILISMTEYLFLCLLRDYHG